LPWGRSTFLEPTDGIVTLGALMVGTDTFLEPMDAAGTVMLGLLNEGVKLICLGAQAQVGWLKEGWREG
jgi:hypothetical protein